jgi:hypothetical protein
MPYIPNKGRRIILDKVVHALLVVLMKCGLKGNLNYFIFKLAKEMCHSYENYRDFIGELECCKLEIYRRLAAPYEDIKIKKNGDVQ